MVPDIDVKGNQNLRLNRVIVYVDGFNLYYGLRESGWKSLYWLDIHGLAQRLIRKNQVLVRVRYFTSRVKGDRERVHRQSVYLDALHAQGNVDIQYGTYSPRIVECPKCPDHRWRVYGEKKTDVNIATSLLLDAMDDAFDIALLVSGDGDLIAPVNAIRERFGPHKQVWVAFPPNRPNRDTENAATGKVRIRRRMLEQCVLPAEIPLGKGVALHRPSQWQADVNPAEVRWQRHTYELPETPSPDARKG